jgi:hypothetical protein
VPAQESGGTPPNRCSQGTAIGLISCAVTHVDGGSGRAQLVELAGLDCAPAEGNPARTQTEHLQAALQSSRLIGCAVGMVMASRGVKYDEALALLKAASNRTNVKLRDLCADMVENGTLWEA